MMGNNIKCVVDIDNCFKYRNMKFKIDGLRQYEVSEIGEENNSVMDMVWVRENRNGDIVFFDENYDVINEFIRVV